MVEEEVPLPSYEYHSPEFVDLIMQCLEKDPLKRPTAEALMAHPFLQMVQLAIWTSLLETKCCQHVELLVKSGYMKAFMIRQQECLHACGTCHRECSAC